MSRSVRSRKSIGAPSVKSTRTTIPRFSSGMSIASHTTERKSQLSLIQRSVPSTFHVKTISTQEKAVRILENFTKRIKKLNLTPDQQFNFSTTLKQLEDLINNPRESGFWHDWIDLKESIIEAVTEQSSQPPDFTSLKTFCDSSFDQFSIGLGDVSEKLPSRFEASKKATEIQKKFTELSESFKRIREKYDKLDEDSNVLQFGSLISTLQSFRQIILSDYNMIFSSLRNPEIKKRVNETPRCVLLSTKQQSQIARNLCSYLENIEFRLNEYINPASAVPSAKDLLQATETNLRKCVTDFPEEKRKQTYRDQSILEEKKKMYYQLEAKLSDLKRQKNELTNSFDHLSTEESLYKEKINEEKDNWLAEKRELAKILNSSNYQDLIEKTSEDLEKLRRQNSKLQNEITSRESNENIDQIRNKAKSIFKHFEDTENRLLDLRSKNFTFIDLLNDDQKAYKENLPRFIEKWQLKIQLDSENELDFHMKQMMDKNREVTQSSGEDAPTKKEFLDIISQNENNFEQIKNQLQTITNLQKKIFKRKLKKLINNSSNKEYQKVSKRLSQIEDVEEEDKSEFGRLKLEAELLQTEFNLCYLRNSQINSQNKNDDNEVERQIQEQKQLNHRIIKNGNQIRLYLLNIQAFNNAMSYAIKAKTDSEKIEHEILNKNKHKMKYKDELLKQENETYELERMLSTKREDNALVETIFANILEKVKKLEEGIDGDLDKKINELRLKISYLNKQKRQQVINSQELTTEDDSQF